MIGPFPVRIFCRKGAQLSMFSDLRFRPRLLDSLKTYERRDFSADLAAGLTVGVVALPLAMAFGIASGVRPEQGIFTAIVAGFLISALGGSRVQIGGPAGAFVALLYAIVERYGLASLLLSTMMAGVLLFLMGAFKLGSLVRFVPVSIVIGFTNGIAVIIAIMQIRDFLGLSIEKMPANFFSQLAALWAALHTLNPYAVALGVVSLIILVIWPKSYHPNQRPWRRIAARVPGTILVLVLGVIAVVAAGLPVETIGSRFGQIPHGLPTMALPQFDWSKAQSLVAPTLSIALLGAIESLLCARIADGLIDDRHDPNQELMAQGVANLAAPLFGGIAATGTIARTVTNVRSGARSPVAGIVHATVLLLIILVAAPVASNIPMVSLAAILLFVAWNMGDWAAFRKLSHYSVSYRTITLLTFFLTVIFDLTVAIEVGLVLASLFFIHRISVLTRLDEVPLPPGQQKRADGRTVKAYRVFGSLFFGSVTKLEQLVEPGRPLPDILILELHQLINLDTTGLEALEGLHKTLTKRGGKLVLTDINEQPASLIRRSGFLETLGSENVYSSLEQALQAH